MTSLTGYSPGMQDHPPQPDPWPAINLGQHRDRHAPACPDPNLILIHSSPSLSRFSKHGQRGGIARGWAGSACPFCQVSLSSDALRSCVQDAAFGTCSAVPKCTAPCETGLKREPGTLEHREWLLPTSPDPPSRDLVVPEPPCVLPGKAPGCACPLPRKESLLYQSECILGSWDHCI